MDDAAEATSSFADQVRALIPSSADRALPRVVYADEHMGQTCALLPAEWPREQVSADTFGHSVRDALQLSSVVAFPPWGRREGRREPHEVASVRPIKPGPPGHLLLLVVPYGVLTSAAAESFRAQIGVMWRLRAVVSGRGGLEGISAQFQFALLLLESMESEPGVVRMFDSTQSRFVDTTTVAADLRRLLRMSGGSTEYGFVLREPPSPGSPLLSRLHDPRLAQRRRELVHFGRVVRLDHLFEVQTCHAELRDFRKTQVRNPDAVGAVVRVVTGRDIMRSHEIAPADDDGSRWVQRGYPELQTGDIVVRALHSANSIYPGIVWARVAPADLPLTAGPHVAILRARADVDQADVEFALRFISSAAALTLSDDPRLPPATMTIGAAALAALHVPLPDAMLKDALASVDLARRRASEWSGEADDILDGLFEYDSAAQARQRVLERSRLVRLRMKAVDDVETLNGQVRTQYPLPIAYRWRVLEAARSHGDTRETYAAAIDAAEQTLAVMANVGLALAREIGEPVSAAATIKGRLARGQGTSMSDWCNILDELAGRAFRGIDDAIATPEFRSFCGESGVKTARQDLLRRRNDEAHGRRAELLDLGEAINGALASLDTLNRALAFLLDNPLVVARNLRWDTIHASGVLEYQQFAGDHAVVPIREMPVTTPTIEAGSLYLLDSRHSLHLLRPFLTGANCQRCGTFSVFCLDHRANGTLTIKSLEHGHSVEAAEPLVRALAAVDVVGEL